MYRSMDSFCFTDFIALHFFLVFPPPPPPLKAIYFDSNIPGLVLDCQVGGLNRENAEVHAL